MSEESPVDSTPASDAPLQWPDTPAEQLALLAGCLARIEDMVIITEATPIDPPGPRMVYVNDAVARRTGHAVAELLGQTPRVFQGPRTQRDVLDRVYAAMRAWQPVRVELINYTRDGTEFWIELDLTPVSNVHGWYTHWISVARDITERKEAEAALAENALRTGDAQRMESLGRLAGGIAHDFNNILSIMLGNVALARLAVDNAGSVSEKLAQIEIAGQRAVDLVRQILVFSRRAPPRVEPLALARTVRESLRLLRATLPAGIEFIVELDDTLPPGRGDATQVQQIVMNLCTNAWRAIEAGTHRPGRLEITLRPVTLGTAEIMGAEGPLPAGRYACLAVTDNGIGMDEAVRRRIFEPFFTTREPGEGTGLGLAVVHGIVAAHGGAITVDSTPGAGTTLRAYFPLQEGGVLPAAVTGEQSPPPVPPARVLFVDDEPQIVALVTELLSAAGHLVTGCVDPLDALATFTTRPADFDVLVSDFNMPRLSGLELAARVRALRQDLPIALVSGYVTPELQQRAAALGIGRVLHKSDLADEVCATIGTLTR